VGDQVVDNWVHLSGAQHDVETIVQDGNYVVTAETLALKVAEYQVFQKGVNDASPVPANESVQLAVPCRITEHEAYASPKRQQTVIKHFHEIEHI
jgi:hypothetical protein